MFSIIPQPASLQAGLPGRIVVRYTHAGDPLAKGASIRMGYDAKSETNQRGEQHGEP